MVRRVVMGGSPELEQAFDEAMGAGHYWRLIAPQSNNGLIYIGWGRDGHETRRGAFCASVDDALRHVIEYERRADTQGEGFAREWQRGEQVLNEASAVTKREANDAHYS